MPDSIADLRAKLAAAPLRWDGEESLISSNDKAVMISAVNFLPALLDIAEAAREVAGLDWRTSVSEREHYSRIDVMNRLRAKLEALK